MRVFLTLCSLVAVGLAKPQYNYGSGVSGTFSGSTGGLGGSLGGLGGGSSGALKFTGGNSGFSSGSTIGSGSSLGGASFGSLGSGSSFGSGSIGGGSFGSGSLGGGSFGSGSIGGGSYGSGSIGGGSQGFESTLVHKQFISVAAPEDHDNLEQNKRLIIGRPQQNYRVVFIKAPSSSNANVRLSAEYAPKEEKTVIYVLSKKDNNLEVGDIATPAPTIPSKPEVFFIKYKTEEEAQHAQRQIQAEYDKIEGSSEHSDAGVAPTQSVIGILGGGDAGGIGGGIGSFGSGSGSSGSFTSGGSSTGSLGFGTSGSLGGGTKASAYLPPVTV